MQEKIPEIVDSITKGEPVVFPTETVYALAADATNPAAIEAIYALKKRQKNKPLAIFCADLSTVEDYVEISAAARRVMMRFMPGPLTCILPIKKGANLAPNLNEGKQTLGIRMPDHEVALSIVKQAGVPIAATSVNQSGDASAVNGEQVKAFCGKKMAYLASQEADKSVKGRASTVVDLSGEQPVLLREGEIHFDEIMALYRG